MKREIQITSRQSGSVRNAIAQLAVVVCIAALSLIATASPAAAAVTIGQVGSSPGLGCANINGLQPTVTSGNGYVVPAIPPASSLVITSWSTSANPGAGPLALRVYRFNSGMNYTAVGIEGPRALTGGVINTFDGINVPVRPGDVLGVNAGSATNCTFSAPGETFLFRPSSAGESGDFVTIADLRANISAVVEPDNRFVLGSVDRNKKKGTATISVEDIPNPGELALSGNGVKTASTGEAVIAKTVSAPGDVKLKIRAKGKKKRKLNENGKVKITPNVTFTPTGGDPNTQSRKLKLKKR